MLSWPDVQKVFKTILKTPSNQMLPNALPTSFIDSIVSLKWK
jgi:hypothetical protein